MRDILIIGPARAGKTTISKRLAKKYGYQIIQNDAIISMLKNTFPELEITHGNYNKKFEVMPFCIAEYYKKFKKDYGLPVVIEGRHVYPKGIKEAFTGIDIEIICLGFPNQAVEEKVKWLIDYAKPDSYTVGRGKDYMIKLATNHVEFSKRIKSEAEECNFPFFDVGKEWEKTHKQIWEFLEQKNKA